MQKIKVKRCIRPQCRKSFPVNERSTFCLCGALLVEDEIKNVNRKNTSKSDDLMSSSKKAHTQKTTEELSTETLTGKKEGKKAHSDEKNKTINEAISEKKASLYLLLDDDEIQFELSEKTRLGRFSNKDEGCIDLSEYAGKEISREHAVIERENNKYFIRNISKSHSVRIINKDEEEYILEHGEKIELKSGEGILLSKKLFLQFMEEE